METEWSREKPVRDFTLDELDALLRQHSVRIVVAEPIGEGKANTNYRLTTGEGRHVLFRYYQRDPKAAAIEIALAKLLTSEAWMPQPLIASAKAGFVVFEYAPGQSLQTTLQSGAETEVVGAAEEIGQTLARIHGIRFPHAGFLDGRLEVSDPWPTSGIGIGGHARYLLRLPKVAQALPEGEAERLESVLRTLDEEIDAFHPTPVLCHGDFKLSNILVHRGRLSAVVDWEFAHSGTPLLDIGQLFRHPLPSGFESAFERGYCGEGGTLLAGWRPLARRADLVNLLDFLGQPGCSARQQEDLLGLIAATD